MKRLHVAFCLEQQYGHIMPSLGIALELTRRGHRVSYAVTSNMAPLVRRVHAHPIIIAPPDIRAKVLTNLLPSDDIKNGVRKETAGEEIIAMKRERTLHSLAELEKLYSHNTPDVVIHDDVYDTAGRELAKKMGIAKIRLQSQFIELDLAELVAHFADDELIVVTVPAFFQPNLDMFDHDPRFKFVGFIAEGRTLAFESWESGGRSKPFILVSATTGMLPQLKYCETILEAFREQPWDVVLSISASLDRISEIDPAAFADIPPNVHINRIAGNFQVLQDSRLFIGQGGQGGTLEAIYWGIPQILVPPTRYHNLVASRVQELGLGICLPLEEFSSQRIIQDVSVLLNDEATYRRVDAAGRSMRNHSGAASAANTIENHVLDLFN